MNALIIGPGQVGRALAGLIEKEGGKVRFFSRDSDRETLPGLVTQSDVCFLAMPTDAFGLIALRYIREVLDLGKVIVLSEKAALACHFESLFPYLSHIGFSATVGGGSRILDLVTLPHLGIRSMTGIINGTLNFLVSEVAIGREIGEVIIEAQKLGLCEHRDTNLTTLVEAEVDDMFRKSLILFNLAELTSLPVCANNSSCTRLRGDTTDDIQGTLCRRAQTHRFVVTINGYGNHVRFLTDEAFTDMPRFTVKKDNWTIRGGYQPIATLPLRVVPRRQMNALTVIYSNGEAVTRYGPGAGPLSTAAVMLADAKRLLQIS